MNNLKFQYKLYLLALFLVSLFIGSSYLYQVNVNVVSDKIKRLSQENESLQKTLILISDIEKLHRNVDEFVLFGNAELLAPIEKTLNQFHEMNQSTNSLDTDDKYQIAYNNIIKNIQKFEHDFEVTKEHIPLNFAFRQSVREDAQLLEDKIDRIKHLSINSQVLLELILIRKSILEIEKGLVRYFETNDNRFVKKTKKEEQNLKKLIGKLYENPSKIDKKDIDDIHEKATALITLVNKTVSHYRTYSMISKVIVPGDMYEIIHYSDRVKLLTKEKINSIQDEIDTLLSSNSKINMLLNIIFAVLILLSFFLLIRALLKPIEDLTEMFEDILSSKEDVQIPEYKQDDIIGKLIKVALEFKLLNKRTNELLVQTEDYKNNLELRVEEETNLRREQEKAMLQQSKLASMGEMIGAIAHQWRQPLNELSIRIQKLKYNYMKDEIDEEFITAFIEKNRTTIEFMSKTIDDFRNFFRIDKEKKEFHLKDTIDEIINIQAAQLKNHNITLEFKGDDFVLHGYKSEFQQVMMNLISNAKDALVENGIQEPKILITLSEHQVRVQDNAGGIPDDILSRVFEPYFTTKEQGKGTGMGLYMSKMIIEDNMGGTINISNKSGGVEVFIDLKVQE